MEGRNKAITFLRDVAQALRLVANLSYERSLSSWLYIPLGIVSLLLVCWGVDRLIHLTKVSFPASVALLLLLFAALNFSQWTLGDRRTRSIVRTIEIPGSFALRWINVFFVPAFVLLPLSPSIGGIEIAKIIGVFVIGYASVLASTAYMVRGLQLLTGSSKRAVVERAEEMGNERDDIPLQETRPSVPEGTPGTQTPASESAIHLPESPPAVHQSEPSLAAAVVSTSATEPLPQQDSIPLTRPQRYAAVLNRHLDLLTWLILLLTIGVPLYFTRISPMPFHLALTVVYYHLATSLPAKYLRVLHPVLVCALVTVLTIWPVGLILGATLRDTLHEYTTGSKYTTLWTPHGASELPGPGAGDVLSSTLDVSIVALALPMFQHRRELRTHFVSIFAPCISLAVGSLFGYPAVCAALGIAPSRSLAFAARSLTLALAYPAAANLGVTETSFVALIGILSGIIGALFGIRFLRYIGIRDDDYVTRGISLGTSSSAIATARLLREDPRAAALSGLAIALYGTVVVGLTSVPPVVDIVRKLAKA